MIVFGNSLVIGAFRVNRRLRTATNLLLMSLAIADMLVGLITVPLWVYILMYYNVVRSVLKFYKMFDVIFVVSSILHLTAVTLERCYALVWPIKHRNIRRHVVIAISCVAWILAILAGTMKELMDELYGVILAAVFFFIPLIIILVAYGKISQVAIAHARGRGNSSFRKVLFIPHCIWIMRSMLTANFIQKREQNKQVDLLLQK
ncbi:hypothetical protein OS493_025399 [Desmophyllum pertusum]|uniref:G-protein coupled receptors family 1 profile domain-containing protein n=1 Tax=Desmophyllum pertusum TaxID=174260 RepID=A0A9W9YLA1_9CNID|nr:hypothetical protein OS493_025399 [Desmophyllum pertusum]